MGRVGGVAAFLRADQNQSRRRSQIGQVLAQDLVAGWLVDMLENMGKHQRIKTRFNGVGTRGPFFGGPGGESAFSGNRD